MWCCGWVMCVSNSAPLCVNIVCVLVHQEFMSVEAPPPMPDTTVGVTSLTVRHTSALSLCPIVCGSPYPFVPLFNRNRQLLPHQLPLQLLQQQLQQQQQAPQQQHHLRGNYKLRHQSTRLCSAPTAAVTRALRRHPPSRALATLQHRLTSESALQYAARLMRVRVVAHTWVRGCMSAASLRLPQTLSLHY